MSDFWIKVKMYCWEIPSDFYYHVRWFFKNLWTFRKNLWEYRNFDYIYAIELFSKALTELANTIEHGVEESRSANKKVKAIRELVGLFDQICANNDYGMYDDYISWKGYEISPEEYRKEYMSCRNKVFDRIHQIIKGKDTNIDVDNYDEWVEQFDGTGIEGWWE